MVCAEISTKRKCNPDNWNVAAGRFDGKGGSVKSFSAYLDTLQQKVSEAKRKLIESDKDIQDKYWVYTLASHDLI